MSSGTSACSILGNITDPVDRCKLALTHCQLDSIVPYGNIIFCKISSPVLSIISLCIAMMLVFGAMGIAAFDHMSPNLTYIAEMSGLSQHLIGVTVLAFGNGSVDVFGALVALKAHEGGMAFGGIMGGAFFVASVVIGSMAIIKPFKIDPSSFKRDAFALMISVVLTLLVIYDGVITLTEALVALCFYTLYAAFVVQQQISCSRKKAADDDERVVNGSVSPLLMVDDSQPLPPSQSLDLPFTALKPSLFSAFDLHRRVHKHLIDTELQVPSPLPDNSEMAPSSQKPSAGNSKRHMRRRSSAPDLVRFSLENDPQGPSLPNAGNVSRRDSRLLNFGYPYGIPELQLPSSGDDSQDKNSNDQNADQNPGSDHHNYHIVPPPASAFLLSDHHYLSPGSPAKSRIFANDDEQDNTLRPFRSFESEHIGYLKNEHYNSPFLMKHLVDRLIESQRSTEPDLVETFDTEIISDETGQIATTSTQRRSSASAISLSRALFPFLEGWSEKGWAQRANEIALAPFMSILECSIPTSTHVNSRLRMCIYSIGVPASLPLLLRSIRASTPLLIIQALVSLAGLFWWGYLERPGPPRLVTAAIGFIMSILWVMLLATELVAIITILGLVSHLNNTVMGLTVFALGDSLGDFISNITVARIGYPTMAVAACFGGPIFTLLVGISGASLYNMLSQRKLEIQFTVTPALLFSGAALFFTLVFLVVVTGLNNNTITKKTGVSLILIWTATVTISTALWH